MQIKKDYRYCPGGMNRVQRISDHSQLIIHDSLFIIIDNFLSMLARKRLTACYQTKKAPECYRSGASKIIG